MIKSPLVGSGLDPDTLKVGRVNVDGVTVAQAAACGDRINISLALSAYFGKRTKLN